MAHKAIRKTIFNPESFCYWVRSGGFCFVVPLIVYHNPKSRSNFFHNFILEHSLFPQLLMGKTFDIFIFFQKPSSPSNLEGTSLFDLH